VTVLKLSTPCILAIIYFFIPTQYTQYVKHIYLSPVTSYMFLCLLHHLQGDIALFAQKLYDFLSVVWGMFGRKKAHLIMAMTKRRCRRVSIKL
jgi:hypothetical protein